MGDLGFGKPIFWVGLAAGIVAGALGYRCVQKRCAAKKAAAALPQASLEVSASSTCQPTICHVIWEKMCCAAGSA